MKIAPLQSWGCGDIIFCQTLAQRWIKEGHEVVWGVRKEFVNDFNRAYPDVKFVDADTLPIDYARMDEHDANGYRVVPLRWSVEIAKVPYKDCMASKFSIFNLHYSIWREGAMWQRDIIKERELFGVLGLNIGEKYALVNETYQTDFKGKAAIAAQFDGRIVKMRTIEGFSLFDWQLTIERATEIHTVSTSLIYILEMLDLKQPIHLYPRIGDPTFSHIDYLFTKPYILHK